MAKAARSDAAAESARITEILAAVGDWRGETLRTMRELIHEADPEVAEELKWKKPSNPDGVPTWSHGGIICTGEIYRGKVKLTFAEGASLPDPAGLFNASLEASVRRAIDLFEGDVVDPTAFRALVRAAVDLNIERAASKRR